MGPVGIPSTYSRRKPVPSFHIDLDPEAERRGDGKPEERRIPERAGGRDGIEFGRNLDGRCHIDGHPILGSYLDRCPGPTADDIDDPTS
jgi:hypothetical protein